MAPNGLVHLPEHWIPAFSWSHSRPGLQSSHLCSEAGRAKLPSFRTGREICRASRMCPRREKLAPAAPPSAVPLGAPAPRLALVLPPCRRGAPQGRRGVRERRFRGQPWPVCSRPSGKGGNSHLPLSCGALLASLSLMLARTAVLRARFSAALRTLAPLTFPAPTPVGDSQARLQPLLSAACLSGNLQQEDRCSRLKESGADVFRGHHPRPFPEM